MPMKIIIINHINYVDIFGYKISYIYYECKIKDIHMEKNLKILFICENFYVSKNNC